MTHPLSGKYPLAEKALDEVKNMARNFGATPNIIAEIEATNFRAAEIIDSCIDRPDNEKEALIAVVALGVIPPDLWHKLSDYNDQVADVLRDAMMDPEQGPPNENAAQLALVIIVGKLEKTGRDLAAGNPASAKKIIAYLAEDAEMMNLLTAHCNAPRLTDLLDKTMNDLKTQLTAPRFSKDQKPPGPTFKP